MGGGGAAGSRAEVLLQPLEEVVVTQVVSLSPKGRTMLEQISDPTLKQMDIHERKCSPQRDNAGAGEEHEE